MDETIMQYKKLAAEEAVKSRDESLSDEERKEHLLLMLRFNQTYKELAQVEHDYNNPVRERKDRNVELIKTAITSILAFAGNIGMAGFFAYIDTREDAIPSFGSKELFKHIRFK